MLHPRANRSTDYQLEINMFISASFILNSVLTTNIVTETSNHLLATRGGVAYLMISPKVPVVAYSHQMFGGSSINAMCPIMTTY